MVASTKLTRISLGGDRTGWKGFISGEVAQWLGHRIADRKVSSSSPDLSIVLRVRDISNLSSHTVHTAECTGNFA